MVGMLSLPPYDKMLEVDRRVYHESGISPTICIVGGGNKEIKIMTNGIDISKTKDYVATPLENVSCTIRSERIASGAIEPTGRIRKLTPKECFRLMDFDDEDFDKAKLSGVSDSQLYKQAGNSICVGVLEAIFKQIL